MSLELQELPEETSEAEQEVIMPVPLPTKSVDDIIDESSKKGKKDDKDKPKAGFWEKLFKRKRLVKPNTVAAIYLRNNGRAEPMELESKRGFFTIYGKTYAEDKDCKFVLGKERIPFIVIREDELVPEGNSNWFDRSLKDRFFRLTHHTLEAIRNAEIVKREGDKSDFKFNAKAAIILGIIAIVGIAIVVSYL